MHKNLSSSIPPRVPGTERSYGVTLVELMIAMVLGILLIGAVISVFLGTSQTYRTQEAMSKVQETGRFAIQMLSRDIRQVGFRGACVPTADVRYLLDETGPGYDAQLFEFDPDPDPMTGVATGPLLGWHQDGGPYETDMNGYVADTDTLLIKKSSSMNVGPIGPTLGNDTKIPLNGPSGIARGQLVVISDANSCDLFQNTAATNANPVRRDASLNPGNRDLATNPSPNDYDQNAQLFRFEPRVYYVGASTADPNQNSLRRVDYALGSANDQELVTGVEDFRIRYGEDTSGDGEINLFRGANTVADWEAVRAIRISLIANSTNTENVVDTPQTLAIDGGTWDAPDRRLYQVFTSTIGLRNRLD